MLGKILIRPTNVCVGVICSMTCIHAGMNTEDWSMTFKIVINANILAVELFEHACTIIITLY